MHSTHLFSVTQYSLALLVTLALGAVMYFVGLPYWAGLSVWMTAGVWLVSCRYTEKRLQQSIKTKYREDMNSSAAVIKKLQDSILDMLQQTLTKPQTEIQLLQNLVTTSAKQLDKSFNGLNLNAKDQGEILLALVGKMSESHSGESSQTTQNQSLKEFANEMRKIIEYFIDQVLTTSQESMTMVHKIDDLVLQMQEVEELVGDVRTIADQTNLLALNAAIEAARAGEAGRGFAVVADEVRKLSQHSNNFSDQINGVVDKALENINEAKQIIGKMASKDMSMAISSKSRVDNMLVEVNHLNEFLSEKLAHASAITDSITENVNLAVMSLQFEDMSKQISDHLHGYIQDSTSFIGEFWRQYSDLLKDLDQPELIDKRINGLQGSLHSFQQQKEKKYMPVSSAQLRHGDVDLF